MVPIHLCGDNVKAFVPSSFLKESNSTPLSLASRFYC